MASAQRIARLREEIKRDVSDILSKMKDPRLGFVTVTDVEVSRDLGYVRIFVSVYGEGDAVEKTWTALKSGTGYVRSELGQRLRLRHVPEIVFKADESAARGQRINSILAQLRESADGEKPS